MKTNKPSKLDKIRKDALERIAKTQQLQIRLDPELWDALLLLAGKRREPVSAMVREWIKEKLSAEADQPHAATKSQLDAIEKKIDKLLHKQTRAQSA